MMISRVAEATIVRVMELSVGYKDFFISLSVVDQVFRANCWSSASMRGLHHIHLGFGDVVVQYVAEPLGDQRVVMPDLAFPRPAALQHARFIDDLGDVFLLA